MTPLATRLAAMSPPQRSAFVDGLDDDDLALVEEALAELEAERAMAADEEQRARADEALGERQARWRVDPVAFAAEAIAWPAGKELKPHQAKALRSLARKRRLALRSLHGVGKTGTAALTVLWFAVTREYAARHDGRDWKIPTTASVYRQLEKYLWPEIHKWAKRLRWDLIGMDPWRKGRELLDLSIKLDHGEAFAAASNDAAKIEGAHADEVMFVFDEAKTIPADTWDAAEGALGQGGDAAAYALALSTPGAPAGRFHAICTRKPGTEEWERQHVTLAEGIASGMVSEEWAEQKRKLWASTPGIYANRVLGEFAEDEGGIIKLSWVEAANERWRALVDSGAVGPSELLGFDVARFGDDETVVVGVSGDFVGRPVVLPPGDSIQTARAALPHCGIGVRGPLVVIDADGVGAGVYDQLRRYRELPARLYAFHGGAKTEWRDVSRELSFYNVRSAAWWSLAELLNPALGATLALPDDDELTADLVTPTWESTNRGILVEPKEDQRKRLGRSPDRGDAVAMALWGRYVRGRRALHATRAKRNGHGPGITEGLLEAAL